MERSEVEDAVRSWLDSQSVNPATGVPPDARLSVSAVRVTTFGAGAIAAAGQTVAPDTWSVTATLFFPPDDDEHLGVKIARILQRFEESLAQAPGNVSWRGTDRGPYTRLDAPAGYPTAVDVLLTVDDA